MHCRSLPFYAATCDAVQIYALSQKRLDKHPSPDACRVAFRCFAMPCISHQGGSQTHAPSVTDAWVSPLSRMACGHLRNGNSRFAPAAPLAGALLICISAVSVSCCAHLSAPDVWQLSFLGAAASLPSHAGNARLLSTSLSSGTAGGGFLRGSWMCADPLTLSLRFAAMGEL